MSNSDVLTEKADNIKSMDDPEDDEEDVPEDFFDDFLKNDFLAGLEVLDEDESPSLAQNKQFDDRSVSRERVFQYDDHSEYQTEQRSVSRERGFKNDSKEVEPTEHVAKKPVKERLGIRVIEDIAVRNSDAKFLENDKVESKKDSAKRSRSAERNGKGSGRSRYSPGRDRRRERGRSKDKRRTSKEKKRTTSKERQQKSDEQENSKDGERRRRTISLERRRRSRSRHRENRSNSKDRNSRRDPSKTMRDIERDKVKCAKDKEAKIISEKLKVVETGLVPPGMEMEMEINEPPIKKRSPGHRSNDTYRRTRIHKDQLGETMKRTRSRSIEAYRRKYSRSPSPKTRRRYRSPSPRREGEYRPRYRRSPLSDRRSEERRRRRSKERKPTFLEELDKKLNVHAEIMKLEQIKEKINGGPSYQPLMMALPSPVPPVNIVSHPSPCFPPPVYDEQFFIGGPQPGGPPPIIQPGPPPPIPLTMASMQIPPPVYSKDMQQLGDRMPQESMESLFNDENISLSAFLSITTRTKDHSKTMDLGEKVKILSRCQDAIKLMTETSKQSGRFYYKGPLKSAERNVDFTNVSPMKRIMPVRLNFTKRNSRKSEEKATTPLELLLHKLGVKQPLKKSASTVYRDGGNLTNHFTQTDSFSCDECEARKRVKTVSTGVQSVQTSSDFSCQVSEDDFLNTARSALKNILKNQSLAALTPAQLMSQLGGNEKEIFPAARKLSGDAKELDSGGAEGIGYNRNNPMPPRMEYNRRQAPMMPPPLMQTPQQGPYQQGGFHPHMQNPQFRPPYYNQPNNFHRY